MSQLTTLATKLSDSHCEGRSFYCSPVPGDQNVLEVILSDCEEIPLYVTVSHTQILCIAYLFKKEEVKEGMLNMLNTQCLQLNIPMPLSAFATIGDQYALFGALSTRCAFEDIQRELIVLGENAVEAMQALEDYFK